MVYTWEELKQSYIAGERFKFLFFWGHTPSAGGHVTETCLSQWWMCSFTVDGTAYSCAEQYMMAEKARMFHDQDMLEQILKAKNPKAMKAYGRAVKNFQKDVWDSACYGLVRKGNMAKFSQNEDLWNYLKTTRKRILVEASPRDRIWGIGMGKSNPEAECPLKWRGSNLLGFALTETRDLLLQEENGEVK